MTDAVTVSLQEYYGLPPSRPDENEDDTPRAVHAAASCVLPLAPSSADVRPAASIPLPQVKKNFSHSTGLCDFVKNIIAVVYYLCSSLTFKDALQQGNIWLVRGALYAGVDPEKALDDQSLPLFAAFHKGQLDAALFLIDRGVDIDARNHIGNTLLDWAIQSACKLPNLKAQLEDFAIEIVRRGGKCIPENDPLYGAYLYGLNKLASELLARGYSGERAFCRLMEEGRDAESLEVVKNNPKAVQGIDSLAHLCAINGCHQTLDYLLENKHVGIDAKDQFGQSLLHAAFIQIERLKDLPALRAKVIEAAKCLVRHGAGNEAEPIYGSLLHLAIALKFDPDLTLMLVRSHKNLLLCNDRGESALHETVRMNDLGAAQELLKEAGPQIALIADKNGVTPVNQAAMDDQFQMLFILVANYFAYQKLADPKMTEQQIARQILEEPDNMLMRRPLHYAAGNGNLDIVQYLVDSGADVDPLDKDGSTPLLIACQQVSAGESSHKEVIKYLKSQGANCEVVNTDDTTPAEAVPSDAPRKIRQEVRTVLQPQPPLKARLKKFFHVK